MPAAAKRLSWKTEVVKSDSVAGLEPLSVPAPLTVTTSVSDTISPVKKNITEAPAGDTSIGSVNDSILEDQGQKESGGSGAFKFVLAFVLGLLVGGGAAGGVFYYKSRMDSLNSGKTAAVVSPTPATPTEAVTVTPEATSSGKINFAGYKLAVMNGTGIAGRASAVKEILKGVGFTDVKTGDADSFNYAATEVSLKKAVPAGVYDAISKALTGSYKMTKIESPLDEKSEFDVLVVLGSSKK